MMKTRMLGLLPLALLCACPSGSPRHTPRTAGTTHDTVTMHDTITVDDTVVVPPQVVVRVDTVRLPGITRVVHDTVQLAAIVRTDTVTVTVAKADSTALKQAQAAAAFSQNALAAEVQQFLTLNNAYTALKANPMRDTIVKTVQLPPVTRHDTVIVTKRDTVIVTKRDTVFVSRETTIPPVAKTAICADPRASAVVLRFTDVTDLGTAARPDIAPLVICGPPATTAIARTYAAWASGTPCPCNNGGVRDTSHNPYSDVILSPADTSSTTWTPDDSVLVRVDSTHWAVRPDVALPWKHFGGVLYGLLTAANVPDIAMGGPAPIPSGWWSYVPTRGGQVRAVLSADSGSTDLANATLTRYVSVGVPQAQF